MPAHYCDLLRRTKPRLREEATEIVLMGRVGLCKRSAVWPAIIVAGLVSAGPAWMEVHKEAEAWSMTLHACDAVHSSHRVVRWSGRLRSVSGKRRRMSNGRGSRLLGQGGMRCMYLQGTLSQVVPVYECRLTRPPTIKSRCVLRVRRRTHANSETSYTCSGGLVRYISKVNIVLMIIMCLPSCRRRPSYSNNR